MDKLIILQGKLLDPDSIPIRGAYIINFRDLTTYSSRENGDFTVLAEPGDSLIVSHISFNRKIIYADSVKTNPGIFLENGSFLMKQFNVGEDVIRNSYLKKNMDSIRNAKIRIYKRMNPETNLVNQTVTENNIVFRSQASSVSIASFSPSKILELVKNDKKKNLKRKGFTFYKSEKQKARKEKKKANKD